MDGTGIYNLVYGTDGKIYDLKNVLQEFWEL